MSDYYMEDEVMQFFQSMKWVLFFVLIWAMISFIVRGFSLPRGAALFTTAILFVGGHRMLGDEEEE